MNGVEIGGRRIEARLADPGMALSILVRPEGQSGGHDPAPRPPRRGPVQVEVRRPRRPGGA